MIKTDNLTFRYNPEGPALLEDISLHIDKGDYVSIVGENGCGKSTLVRLFLGLLKPNSGTVTCNAARIGYVPQKRDFPDGQFPLTVYEMLDSYRRLIHVGDRHKIRESLERIGMLEFQNALVGTLSGGQAQKVYIARALIGKPDLLILDEPSTGVDAKGQKELYSFIRTLNREKELTIVSVEHNLDAAIMNSTLIFHLAGGKGHMCNPEKYATEFLKIGRKISNV